MPLFFFFILTREELRRNVGWQEVDVGRISVVLGNDLPVGDKNCRATVSFYLTLFSTDTTCVCKLQPNSRSREIRFHSSKTKASPSLVAS